MVAFGTLEILSNYLISASTVRVSTLHKQAQILLTNEVGKTSLHYLNRSISLFYCFVKWIEFVNITDFRNAYFRKKRRFYIKMSLLKN